MNKHDAIADVIKAAGFDRMATQYLTEPDKRKQIVSVMRRNIARDPKFGQGAARRFAYLAQHAGD